MQPVVVQHPLAQCHLAAIRAVATPSHQFRRHLNLLARMLFLEATRELPLQEITLQTPLTQTTGSRLARPMVFVPILRAGLGLLDGILPLVPDASVAHVGIKRNEETPCHSPTMPICLRTSPVRTCSCLIPCSPPAAAPARACASSRRREPCASR
uniref:uracil phosphoribosyltransferase n=1 Tax=Prosthecobacter sp. TaxID=1965333 RepID=UPI0037844E27